MLCEIALNTLVLTETSEPGLSAIVKLHSTFLLMHPPHEGFPSSHCSQVSYEQHTIEVSRPCSAVSCNFRIRRDSFCASAFAVLQQVRLSSCMSEYGYTVPAKVKILGRGNVQLKIRAATSNERNSNAPGFADPLQHRLRRAGHEPTTIGFEK